MSFRLTLALPSLVSSNCVHTRDGTFIRSVLAAAFVVILAPVHAATIVTNAGVTETFTVIPAVTEWSTTTVAGDSGQVATAAQMDAEVALLTAAGIVDPVADSFGASPPAAGPLAQWDSVLQNVQTRPTSVRFVPLMASLQNGTGAPVSLLDLDYDLGANLPLGESPGLAGHRVYFSLDGTTWNGIVPISGNGTPGRLATTVNLGSWAADAPLFILWADDNGPNSPDTGFTLDNVHFQPRTIVPPGKTIVWNRAHIVGGAPNGNWDLSGSNYWLEGASPAAFLNNDIAVFSQDGDTTIAVPADITPNATRVTHATGTYTIGGAGRIGGTLTKSNTGTLILNSANTFAATTLSGGTIVTQATGALGTGPLTLEGTGGTLRTEADVSVGGLNGTGPLIKTGSGALALTGVGDATGGLTIQAGKLQIDSDSAVGGPTQSITLDGTTLEATNGGGDLIIADAAGATRTLNFTANGGTISVVNGGAAFRTDRPDSFVGSGPITKTGDGALRMRADQNTLTSPWIVNGGTLEHGDGLTAALGSGLVTVNPGGRLAGRNVAVPNNVTLAGGELGTRTGDGTNFTGAINVTANSTVTMRSYTTNANPQLIMISGVLSGTGELTLNGNNPQTDKALILTNPANTYAGTFRVSPAQILASEPLNFVGSTLNGRPIVLSNASLRVRDDGTGNNTTLAYGNNITVDTGDSVIDVDRSLFGASTGNTVQFGTLAIGTQRLTVNGAFNNYEVAFSGATTLTGDATIAANSNVTLQGAISGAFGLTKEGVARLTLQGTNSYTGATIVNAGTLAGTGSVSGGVSVNTSAALAPGNNGAGIFSIGGDLLLNTGTSFTADLARSGPVPIPGTDYDRLAVGTGGPGASTGTVTLGGADLVLTLGTGIQLNDLFFIVTNDGTDPVVGIFSGRPDNTDFTIGSQIFRISYDADSSGNSFNGGNDIALLAVPEPGSAALALLGSALLLRRRK